MKRIYKAPVYIYKGAFCLCRGGVDGMNCVCIVGAFTFTGYNLVEKMISEGIEVYGIDFDEREKMQKIDEEKLYLIGRNALFSYHSLQEDEGWQAIEEHEIDAVYVCLYEPNRRTGFRDEQIGLQYIKRMSRLCKRKGIKLVVLSSAEVDDLQSNSENKMFFARIEEQVKKNSEHYSILRVPAVYGPWQPSFMAYHQLMLCDVMNREKVSTIEESHFDLLYVEDVCSCLYRSGIKDVNVGTYVIGSGEERLWEKGMERLQSAMQLASPLPIKNREPRQMIFIEKGVTLDEGLQKQKRHIKRYKELYEEQSTW